MSFDKIVSTLQSKVRGDRALWSQMVDLVAASEEYTTQFEAGKELSNDDATTIVNSMFYNLEHEYLQANWKAYTQETKDIQAQLDQGKLTQTEFNDAYNKCYNKHRDVDTTLLEAFKNSTYRSIKSVLKNATQYGLVIQDTNGKPIPKSALEFSIKSFKNDKVTTHGMLLSEARDHICKGHNKLARVLYDSSYLDKGREQVAKDITEMLVSVRSIDRFLTDKLSKYKE